MDLPRLTVEFSVVAMAGYGELADQAQLESLARAILEAEQATGAWEVTVGLISDDELQALHLKFMDIDEPTDIMTFPFGDGMLGGDLAISADHASARAVEWGNSPKQEIEFLVAHGILHLLGWQDASVETREVMLLRQQHLVNHWRATQST